MSKCIDTATDFEIGYAIGVLSATTKTNGLFSTIEIIRKILDDGSYHCDTGMPAGSSPNARFGKKLSANALSYRIQLVSTDNPDKDDSGNQTTTAIWRPV